MKGIMVCKYQEFTREEKLKSIIPISIWREANFVFNIQSRYFMIWWLVKFNMISKCVSVKLKKPIDNKFKLKLTSQLEDWKK